MKKLLALAFACLSLGLVATGCGGDDDEEDSGGSADQPAQTTEKKPAAANDGPARGAAEVGLQDIAFDPQEVTVKKGGTVTWTNNESVPHDVTKEDGPGPDFSSGDGNMQEGDTFKQKFSAPGEVSYICTVHPNMTGTVTVK